MEVSGKLTRVRYKSKQIIEALPLKLVDHDNLELQRNLIHNYDSGTFYLGYIVYRDSR